MSRRPVLFVSFFVTLLAMSALAQEATVLRQFPSPPPAGSQTANIWNPTELFSTPSTFAIEPGGFLERDGITPIFFEGPPYQGKPPRVFAWIGIPPGEGKVLVHGGGGTAFRDWVKIWMD